MRTYLECIPCFFRQALETSKVAGANVRIQKKVLDRLGSELSGLPLRQSPPELAVTVYGMISRLTGKRDPYAAIKARSNRSALRIYPAVKRRLDRSRHLLRDAVRFAIAGNIIDYGAGQKLNIQKELRKILGSGKRPAARVALFDLPQLERALGKARTLLYLADNAGEVVFDRVLIETLKGLYPELHVCYAVKAGPAINDAMEEDAHACGIGSVAEVISSGSGAPGTVLRLCSAGFRRSFWKADVVISKGQGNFEALEGVRRPVFFLFIVKCAVVARDTGHSAGSMILHYVGKRSGPTAK